jgi:hypothetical protein
MSKTMAHVLLAPPFPWPELGGVDVGSNISVNWLLAVRISEAERQLIGNQGFDIFEDLMQRGDVPCWDLDRPSVA